MRSETAAGNPGKEKSNMRIAVFDYRVIPTNPVGGCHLNLIAGLCHLHDFTVFAVDFENPCPDRVRWVRIPVPLRPYLLLYVAYHLVAPIVYAWHYFILGARFDLIQMVESNLTFGDISYTHFCHRMYMKRHWHTARIGGIRGLLRSFSHRVAAIAEPFVYSRVHRVVVPSRGLCVELGEAYPAQESKLFVLSNPVDVTGIRPPDHAARLSSRRTLGLMDEDLVLVFAALGHFERKGLPLLLDAIRELGDARVKLLVIGGMTDLVSEYNERTRAMGLERQVRFEGMKQDLRPYYWSADALVLPSCYETFSLVTFEAAAAGLPLIATRLHGVEDMLRHLETGLLIDRSSLGIQDGIRQFCALTPEDRFRMGEKARQTALTYSRENFVAAWENFYDQMAQLRGTGAAS